MTLRSRIETTIRTSADPGQAALTVCRLLEAEIGLVSNGWFDDDDEFLKLLQGTAPDAEIGIADDDELLRLVAAVAPEIKSTDHWDIRAQAIEAALKNRLRASEKKVTPANLMQELAECAEADLEAILELDNVPPAELAALRKLVHVRLQLSARQHSVAPTAADEAASILAAEGVQVPVFRLRAWATCNGVTAASDIVDAWLHMVEQH